MSFCSISHDEWICCATVKQVCYLHTFASGQIQLLSLFCSRFCPHLVRWVVLNLCRFYWEPTGSVLCVHQCSVIDTWVQFHLFEQWTQTDHQSYVLHQILKAVNLSKEAVLSLQFSSGVLAADSELSGIAGSWFGLLCEYFSIQEVE